MNEVRADCLIWLGRDEEARAELEDAARGIDPSETDWTRRLLERIRMVEDRLQTSHDGALALLDDWAKQTTESLGLGRLGEK